MQLVYLNYRAKFQSDTWCFDPPKAIFLSKTLLQIMTSYFQMQFPAVLFDVRKTKGTVGFLRTFCIRNNPLFSKFSNLKI